MLLGNMNNPSLNLYKEIERVLKEGWNFLDLTLENPKAHAATIDIEKTKRLIEKFRNETVGHTGWYLPIGHPMEEIREISFLELLQSLDAFERLGVKKMNVHPNITEGLDEKQALKYNIDSLKRLVKAGNSVNIMIMVENVPGMFSNPKYIGELLKIKGLKFHYDAAHAHIENTEYLLIEKFGKCIEHVHFSDNKGKMDEHLPIGKGNINWKKVIKMLKDNGYDGTVSLEIFSGGKKGRTESMKKLREMW